MAEQIRKQLMARSPSWGDPPGITDSRAHLPLVATRDSALQHTVADSAVDEMIMKDPLARGIRPPAPPTVDSCREWTLQSLLTRSKNFRRVPRIRWVASKNTGVEIRKFNAESPGVPLVVEGLHGHPKWTPHQFTPEWLLKHAQSQDISVRNVHNRTDKTISLSDFFKHAREISPYTTSPEETERFYGKDVACPPEWNTFLHSGVIPHFLTPDGDNVLKNLPPSDRPETLMCYLGIGDTFTPCHKDLCASHGHNLMTWTDGGSSFWFMTASSSANAAAAYFHDKLKEELDHETHVVTLDELAKAPFDVYITEQKLGDLVLVPPRSAHQVMNSGGITIKTSWSRMTVDGLNLALRYELPLYRRLCRVETYRVKSTIYHTLLLTIKRADGRELPTGMGSMTPSNIDTLLRLFDSILQEEYSRGAQNITTLPSKIAGDRNHDIGQLACDFCGADLFQSFFECSSCVAQDSQKPVTHGHGFLICPGCYVEGRSCHCETMSPMQCRPFKELQNTRERGVALLSKLNGGKTGLPPLKELFADKDRPGLFRAALVLHNLRKSKSPDNGRMCTVQRDKALNHRTTASWVMPCKQCHAATCFAHIAWEKKIHSAQALLSHDSDDTHARYHLAHKDSPRMFSSKIDALQREDPVLVPDLRVQLASLVNTYSTCRPIHPNSSLRKAGFYDLAVWEVQPPEIATEPSTLAMPPAVAGSSTKPKRMVMDCVLLTRLPRQLEPKESLVTDISKVEFNKRKAERNKSKPSQRSKGPSGSRTTRAPVPSKSVKNVPLLDSESETDSDDDEPLAKRPRLSRPFTDLRFRESGPTIASSVATSVADAYNSVYASSQNNTPVPKLARLSASSLAAPALPQKSASHKSTAADTSRSGRQVSPSAERTPTSAANPSSSETFRPQRSIPNLAPRPASSFTDPIPSWKPTKRKSAAASTSAAASRLGRQDSPPPERTSVAPSSGDPFHGEPAVARETLDDIPDFAPQPVQSSTDTAPPSRKQAKRKSGIASTSTAASRPNHRASSPLERTRPSDATGPAGDPVHAMIQETWDEVQAMRHSLNTQVEPQRVTEPRAGFSTRPMREASPSMEPSASSAPNVELERRFARMEHLLHQLMVAMHDQQTHQFEQVQQVTDALRAIERRSGNTSAETVREMGGFVNTLFAHVPPAQVNFGYNYLPAPPPPLPRRRNSPWGDGGYREHHWAMVPRDDYPAYRPKNRTNRRSGHSSTSLNVRYERRTWPPEGQEGHEEEEHRRYHPYPEGKRESRRRGSPRYDDAAPRDSRPERDESGPHPHDAVTADGQPPAANNTPVAPEKEKEKFFPVAARERSHTPDQDWEADYDEEHEK